MEERISLKRLSKRGEMMDDKLDMGDIAFFILMAVIFIIIAIWLNDWLKPRLEARFGVIE